MQKLTAEREMAHIEMNKLDVASSCVHRTYFQFDIRVEFFRSLD